MPLHVSTATRLVQICPPGRGGVFDYLQCLRSEWQSCGVSSDLIQLSQEAAAEAPLTLRIEQLLGRPHGTPCSLVVHFSGYGYGQRGLCWWLLSELQMLRAQYGERLHMVVVFHELFASGHPGQSAFWLSPLQALIAKRLARMADAMWTNTQHHAEWLRAAVDREVDIKVRPVFSNVGEAGEPAASADRLPQAVVFGSPSTRQRAFDQLSKHESALRRLGVEALVEVGPGPASTGRPRSLSCHEAGRLDQPELGRLLLRSRYGLLDYPSQFLGKSGVFAAYAAHGCVVIDTCQRGPDTDGLKAGVHYVVLPEVAAQRQHLPLHATACAPLSSSLFEWYGNHRLDRQAGELLELATA